MRRFSSLRRLLCCLTAPRQAAVGQLLLGLLSLSPLSYAEVTAPQATASATGKVEQLSQEQQASQALDQQIEQLRRQRQQLTLELETQRIYNAHLGQLLHSSQQALEQTRQQLDSIADTEQQLIPLMYQMIAELQAYVAQDLPLQRPRRQARIAELQQMMGQNGPTDADKLRRILEVYDTELDYNRQLGHYRAEVSIEGQARHLELLHLGKLALFARTPDHSQNWYWESDRQRWQPLPDHSRAALDAAFAISAERQLPALLTLPLRPAVTEGPQS